MTRLLIITLVYWSWDSGTSPALRQQKYELTRTWVEHCPTSRGGAISGTISEVAVHAKPLSRPICEAIAESQLESIIPLLLIPFVTVKWLNCVARCCLYGWVNVHECICSRLAQSVDRLTCDSRVVDESYSWMRALLVLFTKIRWWRKIGLITVVGITNGMFGGSDTRHSMEILASGLVISCTNEFQNFSCLASTSAGSGHMPVFVYKTLHNMTIGYYPWCSAQFSVFYTLALYTGRATCTYLSKSHIHKDTFIQVSCCSTWPPPDSLVCIASKTSSPVRWW